MPSKSKQKFAVLGNRELLVKVPLPMAEVQQELQAQVEQLAGHAGLRIIGTIPRRQDWGYPTQIGNSGLETFPGV